MTTVHRSGILLAKILCSGPINAFFHDNIGFIIPPWDEIPGMIGTHSIPIPEPSEPAVDFELVNMAFYMDAEGIPVPVGILLQQFVIAMYDDVLRVGVPVGPFFGFLDVTEDNADRRIDDYFIMRVEVGGFRRKAIGPMNSWVSVLKVLGDLVYGIRTKGEQKYGH